MKWLVKETATIMSEAKTCGSLSKRFRTVNRKNTLQA